MIRVIPLLFRGILILESDDYFMPSVSPVKSSV